MTGSARPALLSLLFGTLLAACGGSEAHPVNASNEDEPVQVATDEPATDEPATDEAPVTLPADLHAVVFFRGESGLEHLDVRLISEGPRTELSGVRADEGRGHPPLNRFELGADERAEYEARIRELSEMPRCEPLGRMPDEPTFRIESDVYTDEGPSLWFRENGAALLADEDHCLAGVRLAHFVYQTWMAQPSR